MAQPSRIPKLMVGMGDLRGLPLAPIDGFVMSRINGALSVRDIAAHTGLAEEVVVGSLDKLRTLGVVAFDGEPQVAPRVSPPPTPAPPLERRSEPGLPPRRGSSPELAPPGPPSRASLPPIYDPRELDEACDLDATGKRRVLDLFYELDELNYYQLLSVERSADKKEIKRAYFEMASVFHPDKFFRKELGSFKQKMEIIFGRVTEAHDALTSKTQRPEYDSYLEAREQARGIEATIAIGRDELARAQERVRKETPSVPPPPPAQPAAPTPLPPGPMPELRAPIAARDAREALARRLMGSSSRPSVAPKASGPPSTQEAMDSLKRRMDDRRADASQAQVAKYRSDADAARAKGDLPAAAAAYRIAAGLAPSNEELRLLAESTQAEADRVLADTYMKQADYEERSGHWNEAARSWGRVAKGRKDDPAVHERFANALMRASGNLHAAADAAKRAIELAPDEVRYRMTLANVYLAAQLPTAARRECEAAAKLKPDDPEVNAMLRKLQKAP